MDVPAGPEEPNVLTVLAESAEEVELPVGRNSLEAVVIDFDLVAWEVVEMV